MNTVDGVSQLEVEMIHNTLSKMYSPIYADIWKIGVNLSLRIGDLLQLKYEDLNVTDRSVKLTEAKTGKAKQIRLNNAALAVITRRRQEHPSDTWLFQVHSNRAKDKPISRVSVGRVFSEVGERLGLTINTHSMRKSRGKALYDNHVPIEKIAKVLNHSNTSSTLRYLGITREEVLQTYDDFEL